MKFLGLTLLIIGFAGCQSAEVAQALEAQSRSISSMIVDTLEAMKIQMEEGWPQYGIPPMAPLVLNHKELNFDSANGEFDNIVIQGLNEFEIVSLKTSPLLSRMTFEFNFASLNVTTNYKADIGSSSRMQRNGGAFLALEDLNIDGQIKYSLGVISGNVKIKDIKILIKVGNVVSNIENLSKYRILNRKLNEVVEEFITLTINDNTDFVAEWIDTTATPVMNDLIGDKSLADILGIINGGGSGGSSNNA
ncbi:uncharacterized protein LOC115626181 [Scaptodrosophila lebanonensis]|uniref:Uncharacterized protein LOC115626181 n=1 Tax=Drosophila lebanonensis TaxID=7225 RepID=A0A6J2TQD5_DROLE|nr:uncharacterized protein LOC115626181 [Scaptodrosophila lebanonensis]